MMHPDVARLIPNRAHLGDWIRMLEVADPDDDNAVPRIFEMLESDLKKNDSCSAHAGAVAMWEAQRRMSIPLF